MLLSFMITIMCDKYEVGVYGRRLGYGKLWRTSYLDEDGMDYFCELIRKRFNCRQQNMETEQAWWRCSLVAHYLNITILS